MKKKKYTKKIKKQTRKQSRKQLRKQSRGKTKNRKSKRNKRNKRMKGGTIINSIPDFDRETKRKRNDLKSFLAMEGETIYRKKIELARKGLRNNLEKQKLAERQSKFVQKKRQLAVEQSRIQHRLESNPENVLGLESSGMDIIFDADDHLIASKGGISGILHLLLNKNDIFYCQDRYFIWKTPNIDTTTDFSLSREIAKEVPLRKLTEQDGFRLKFTSKDNNQILGLGGKKIFPLLFKKFNYNPWIINHSRYAGHTGTPDKDNIKFEYIPTGSLDDSIISDEILKTSKWDKIKDLVNTQDIDNINKLTDNQYREYLRQNLDEEFKKDTEINPEDEELLEILNNENKQHTGGGQKIDTIKDVMKMGKDSLKRAIIGEGLIFTKVYPEKKEGNPFIMIRTSNHPIIKKLNKGESILLKKGCYIAYETTLKYEIVPLNENYSTKDLAKIKATTGFDLFLVKFTGPGTVIIDSSTNDSNILDAGLKMTRDGLKAYKDAKDEDKLTGSTAIKSGKQFTNKALSTVTLGASDAFGFKPFADKGGGGYLA